MSPGVTLIDRLRAASAGISGVRLAFLFGSRARGQARRDSDIDVAVLLDEEAARADRGATIRQVAAELGRTVSAAHLDLVVLNDAPALLRQRVLRDGIVLYQRSPADRVRFAVKAIRDYQDGQIRRERFTRARIRKLGAQSDDGGSRDLLEKARGVARLLEPASRLP
ncbi:MAG: nucleotidyltransferase domain-containing protein [Acidobacteria bacterium]|nr:nucleotidyltransferase domain-containing protein [Acidobacteriota bacterium]